MDVPFIQWHDVSSFKLKYLEKLHLQLPLWNIFNSKFFPSGNKLPNGRVTVNTRVTFLT